MNSSFPNSLIDSFRKYDCGSTVVSTLSSILVYWYLWRLSEVYLDDFGDVRRFRRRRFHRRNANNRLWYMKVIESNKMSEMYCMKCIIECIIEFIRIHRMIEMNRKLKLNLYF